MDLLRGAIGLLASITHKNFEDYVVWQELYENLVSILSLFRSESFLPALQSYVKRIFDPRMQELGWTVNNGEDPRVGSLRAAVISILGAVRDEPVLKKSFDLLVAFMEDHDTNSLDGDMLGAIFKNAMRYDEERVYTLLRELVNDHRVSPEETREALQALGSVKDLRRHMDMLEYALFSGSVRLQDVSFILSSLAMSSDEGGFRTWKFFTDNYDRIHQAVGDGPLWSAVSGLCCRGLRTLDQAQEVQDFWQVHDPKSAKRRVAQSLELVRTNATRRNRDRVALAAFFSSC